MQIIKNFAILAIATICSLPTMGQDLLARQAPIDRKMKAVDSVALQRLIFTENYDSPAEDLYEDWSNKYAHHETALPDSFRISLKDFCMPTTSRVLTSNFGARWGRQHKGLDIKVYTGDICRTFRGRLDLDKVRRYLYRRGHGHLSEQLVEEDQEVRAGDVIGLGGNTGRSTGSHLHFETRLCGVALNPALMFDFRNQDVIDDYYMFHKDTYQRESVIATRLRGVGGASFSGEGDEEVELASAAPAASYQHESRFHKVRKGETLYSIARKRGTTVNAIMKLNHLKSNAKLKPGQILKFN